MTLELSDAERELLNELLEAAHTQTLHELHHTATAEYKDLLRRRLETLEQLRLRMVMVARAR
ncbi:MAG: hypothetical protein U0527_03405 [Candidatus Eisenbacteria bacterium]